MASLLVAPTKLKRLEFAPCPLMATGPVFGMEARFVLTFEQCRLLRTKPDQMQLQACATLLDDEYAFRMHWPNEQDFRINNVGYRCEPACCVWRGGGGWSGAVDVSEGVRQPPQLMR